jgi:hypothetical protein
MPYDALTTVPAASVTRSPSRPSGPITAGLPVVLDEVTYSFNLGSHETRGKLKLSQLGNGGPLDPSGCGRTPRRIFDPDRSSICASRRGLSPRPPCIRFQSASPDCRAPNRSDRPQTSSTASRAVCRRGRRFRIHARSRSRPTLSNQLQERRVACAALVARAAPWRTTVAATFARCATAVMASSLRRRALLPDAATTLTVSPALRP